MILVENITIEEFRGIRKLTLNFKGKNFAVCGPNGTGKSGVVDALEFGLTGNISRLSGKGMGGITLKDHAPHVDSRNNPEKSKVSLTLHIPSLNNKQVIIERSVREASNPTIIPNTPDVLEILKQIEVHPEFVLSRRELITYVLATPGDRSAEVQALLRLDQIGELRSILKTISNTCNREEADSKKIYIQKRDHLAQALEIAELNPNNLLEAVNLRRSVLGLGPIETLTSVTSLRDGLETNVRLATPSKINKTQASSCIEKLYELLQKLSSAEFSVECEDLRSKITLFNKDRDVLDAVSREKFLRMSINLITENLCPVCGTEWDAMELRSVVEKKLKKFEEITKVRTSIEQRLIPIIDILSEIKDCVALSERITKILDDKLSAPLNSYRLEIEKRSKHLEDFSQLVDVVSSLYNLSVIPIEVTAAINSLRGLIAKIPEPTQQEAARDYLVLCQDRLETYREAARDVEKTKQHAALVKIVHDTYIDISNKVLQCVYKKVEEEFGALYRFINRDDEGCFTAHLAPSMGKLGFDVDFYGRGHFPPGAYHSEGHQDSMGLCLYLALMQRLQGDKFSFAVFDDVLMSVDTGHRREVCKLLKERFPNTQFILTTHDEVWLKHMASVGLINSSSAVRFNNWTPENGPTEWNNIDVWDKIGSALKRNDVHEAASDLRYYLEHIFKEICDDLHAPVEYRGDGRYELGDLLPSAVKRLRGFFLTAKAAAESWGKTSEAEAISQLEKKLAEALIASNAEQWQINSSVHYNEWANLTAKDFAVVVDAFHDLVRQFFCDKSECGSLLYITMAQGKTFDTIRCACGSTNLNLKKRQVSSGK